MHMCSLPLASRGLQGAFYSLGVFYASGRHRYAPQLSELMSMEEIGGTPPAALVLHQHCISTASALYRRRMGCLRWRKFVCSTGKQHRTEAAAAPRRCHPERRRWWWRCATSSPGRSCTRHTGSGTGRARCGTVRDCSGLFGTVRDCLGLFGMADAGLFGMARDCSGLFGMAGAGLCTGNGPACGAVMELPRRG